MTAYTYRIVIGYQINDLLSVTLYTVFINSDFTSVERTFNGHNENQTM